MPAKLTYTREADYRQERDFGAKVSATFEFVMAQFRPLFKCLLYFVLPGALLAGIGAGLFVGNFLALMPKVGAAGHGRAMSTTAGSPGNFFTPAAFAGLGMATVGFMAAFLLLSSTVYAFVRVRMNTPPQEAVKPAEVWAFVWRRLGRMVGALLVLALLMTAVSAAVIGCLALLGPAFMVLGFFPMAWAVVCLTLYFPVLWMEDEGIIAALRRSFYLIKGKWWSSLGLYLMMSFITGILNYVFMIPFYGLIVARTMLRLPGFDSELLSVAAMSIYALGWIFTAVLPLVAMLFQYFNVVERKDAVGLRLLVDSLGQTPAPQVSNSTYRPDEEGEY